MTSELSLTGYPPQDLLFREDFNKKIELYKKIIRLTKNQETIFALSIPVVENKKNLNSLILIQSGKLIYSTHKKELPNYGVFDELRYFNSKTSKKITLTIKIRKLIF